MIDKKEKTFKRTKCGDANFEYVEVVVQDIKWDHTTVKEHDGQDKKSSARVDGQTEKEK